MTTVSMTLAGDADDNRLLKTNLIRKSPDCPRVKNLRHLLDFSASLQTRWRRGGVVL